MWCVMGGEPTQLQGPDLTRGIALGDVPDGGTLLGHANGEAVVLARRGDEVFAIGATCTHYGGPLAEGLVVGDVVRCPWHHACFSLRTGDALDPPALNPVPCWDVQRREARLFVGAKRERDALGDGSARPLAARSGPEPRDVVIVGGGAAGSAAAEMLRRVGYDGRVTMIEPDLAAPYDRPNLSKDYLAGNAPEEWIPLRPGGFYAAHGIEVVRTRATRIDPSTKHVVLSDGTSRTFDRLLLATGADPVRLPLSGAGAARVQYLRSLADSRAIIERAERATQAVVIGASFIGLEVAASLRARNLAVHVVAPEARPFERVLGAPFGDFIRGLHEEHGVVFHLGRTVATIDERRVVLDDGTAITADLVVAGVGVRPDIALAEQAGLALDRGVAVDARLETSAPGIFAAGDIARWPDPHSGSAIRVEHWAVAQRQGQAAARNMLGASEPFTAVPFFWSAHYDVSINYVGHAEHWDRIDMSGAPAERDCVAAYRVGERTLAVASIFRDRESLLAEVAMEHDDAPALRALVPTA